MGAADVLEEGNNDDDVDDDDDADDEEDDDVCCESELPVFSIDANIADNAIFILCALVAV